VTRRVFCDSSVLLRYFLGDDPVRGFAAAGLIDGDDSLVISTGVLLEVVHVMRRETGADDPAIAELLVAFLSRENVELADADRAHTIAGLRWSTRGSARRIPDVLLATAADRARCEVIATFDEAFDSPSVPVRLL
jgi:predicted nucleic acid-binding protein